MSRDEIRLKPNQKGLERPEFDKEFSVVFATDPDTDREVAELSINHTLIADVFITEGKDTELSILFHGPPEGLSMPVPLDEFLQMLDNAKKVLIDNDYSGF